MGAIEEICCAGCGDGLGLYYPAGKYSSSVYCDDCYGGVESEKDQCEEEREEVDSKVAELERDLDAANAEIEELQQAEIDEADSKAEEEAEEEEDEEEEEEEEREPMEPIPA